MDDRASKGGKARASKLTPEQRSAAARYAVQARWNKFRQRTHPEYWVSRCTTETVCTTPIFSASFIAHPIRQRSR